MRLFKTTEQPSMGAMGKTARKVLVQWDDGSQQEMGVPDMIEDVAEFLAEDGKKVISWTETVPRSNKPEIRPDRKC